MWFFLLLARGGAVSILNVIANGGLIPIITKSTGLDVEGFGILIEKPELESLKYAIEKALSIEKYKLTEMSILAKKNIRSNYTYDEYKKNLRLEINKVIYE